MESDAGGGEPVVGGSVEEAPGDVSRKGLTTYVNYLKLLTAFLAQQCFASNRRVMSILLHLDNVTAIPFLNTMGVPTQHNYAAWLWKYGNGAYTGNKDPNRTPTKAPLKVRQHPGRLAVQACG